MMPPEITRISLGFENPNHLAALLILVSPFLWEVESRIKEQERPAYFTVATWVLNLTVIALLALSGSRAGLIGWLSAFVVYFYVRRRSACSAHLVSIRSATIKLGFMLVATVFTTLGARLMAATSGPGSITNRLELWANALQLVNLCPSGVGRGNSGLFIMQWLQEPAALTSYGGTVNTFLHIGSEFGLLTLWLVAIALIAIVVSGIVQSSAPHQNSILPTVTSSALLGLSVASVFSTLWLNPVIYLPTAAIVALHAFALPSFTARATRLITYAALIGATLLVTGVYGLGAWLNSRSTDRLRVDSSGVVTLLGGKTKLPKLAILTDYATLGDYPGRVLRGSSVRQRFSEITVFTPGEGPGALADVALVLGARIGELKNLDQERVIAAAPTGTPEVAAAKVRMLLLPEVDEIGTGGIWRHWAKQNGVEIRILPGAGQRLDSSLEIILNLCAINTESAP